MGVVNGTRDGLDNIGGLLRIEGDLLQMLFQIAAFDQLHTKVQPPLMFSNFVDRDNVRMRKRRNCLGFQPKSIAIGTMALDHLQRDDTIQLGVTGLVDNPHPADANFLQHLIVTKPFPGVAWRLIRQGLWRREIECELLELPPVFHEFGQFISPFRELSDQQIWIDVAGRFKQ